MYHAQSPIIIHRHVITITITVSSTSRLLLIKNYTFRAKELQIQKGMIVQFFGLKNNIFIHRHASKTNNTQLFNLQMYTPSLHDILSQKA